MRFISSLFVMAIASSASAGYLSSAMIDDFSGPNSAGLGYSRSSSGGAGEVDGVGVMPSGGSFTYFAGKSVFNPAVFSGISLRVIGGLGSGTLSLSILGEFSNYVALDVPLNGSLDGEYVWITFDQISAEVGYESAFIGSSMLEGEGVLGIALAYSGGTGPITIDDFEFRTSAVPAPGALALLGAAGLAGSRRRR